MTQTTPNALQEEIDALQEEMKRRGVVDVKLAYSPERVQQIHEELVERELNVMFVDAITFIRAILDGKTKPFKGIGDSVRGEPKE